MAYGCGKSRSTLANFHFEVYDFQSDLPAGKAGKNVSSLKHLVIENTMKTER